MKPERAEKKQFESLGIAEQGPKARDQKIELPKLEGDKPETYKNSKKVRRDFIEEELSKEQESRNAHVSVLSDPLTNVARNIEDTTLQKEEGSAQDTGQMNTNEDQMTGLKEIKEKL